MEFCRIRPYSPQCLIINKSIMLNIDFSLNRFFLVTKRDIMENLRSDLYKMLGLYIGLTISYLFVTSAFWFFKDGSLAVPYRYVCNWILFIVLSINSAFYASNIFKNMRSKTDRISFLTLPASQFEKFASRVLRVTILYAIMFVTAAFFAELSRILIATLMGFTSEYSAFLSFDGFFYIRKLQEVTSTMPDGNPVSLFIYSNYYFAAVVFSWIFTFSTYVLGGCIWRKLPFFKTLGVTYAVQSVVSTSIALYFISTVFKEGADVQYYFQFFSDNMNIILLIIIPIKIALTIAAWILSYKCFKRSQLV